MQIMLTGFLGKTKARDFMGELWTLFMDAQANEYGLPRELIEMKKAELAKKKVGPLLERIYKHLYLSIILI